VKIRFYQCKTVVLNYINHYEQIWMEVLILAILIPLTWYAYHYGLGPLVPMSFLTTFVFSLSLGCHLVIAIQHWWLKRRKN